MKKLTKTLQDKDNLEYSGIDELWANEKFLKNYNRDIVKKLSKFCKNTTCVLEFGAGLGTLARIWEVETGVKPECLEIDSKLREILSERGFYCYKNIDDLNKTYDIIYTSNVLEHIDDDVDILKKLHEKINPSGYIAIYVPAFMCLYNELDLAVGHYRRYKKKELIEKLSLAGYKSVDSYYVDSIGFFAWLYLSVKGYNSTNKLGSNNSLEFYDKFIYPISRFFDLVGSRLFFGKNLLVLAKKSTELNSN